MKSREFMIKGLGAGLAGALTPMFGGLDTLAQVPAQNGIYDMAAVRGGEPAQMFDKVMESLGGMGGFVKSGQKVLVF